MDPSTGKKVYNPKEIADAFSAYYGSLYDLQNDPSTSQPTPEIISKFLASISLPVIQKQDLDCPNAPFFPFQI